MAKKLRKAGFEAYFIGGCVRDMILGYPSMLHYQRQHSCSAYNDNRTASSRDNSYYSNNAASVGYGVAATSSFLSDEDEEDYHDDYEDEE